VPDEQIAELRLKYDDCFACGLANPIGLKLDNFRRRHGEAVATFHPSPHHRGTAGSLHGGVTATALDEIMVWAAILFEDTLAVTATMDVRYRRPLGLEGPLTVAGRVEDRSGSRLRLGGQIRLEDRVMVEATGLYLATDPVEVLLG
jgi:acyl-coenzyme A thioesterase PaaI-like protein